MLKIQHSHGRHVLEKHYLKTLFLETVLEFRSSVGWRINSVTLHSVALH